MSRKLVSRHKLATIVSCVPAAPNTDRRLYEVEVTVDEARDALKFCDKVLRVGAGLLTARFAWSDEQDTRDRVLQVFGATPEGSVSATNPALTVASLVPINLELELKPMARAVAAQELATQLDHWEGTLAVPMTKALAPIGSIQVVTHRVLRREAVTLVQALGQMPAIASPVPPAPQRAFARGASYVDVGSTRRATRGAELVVRRRSPLPPQPLGTADTLPPRLRSSAREQRLRESSEEVHTPSQELVLLQTENGASVGDAFMSLIHTAELNGVNPFEYLFALLRHSAEVAANPSAWLPWNYASATSAK